MNRVHPIWAPRAGSGSANRLPWIHLAKRNIVVPSHLRCDGHFCSSDCGDGLAVDGQWVVVGRVKFVQLLSFLVYGTASSQVDEEGDENHHPDVIRSVTLLRRLLISTAKFLPDRAIKDSDSKDIPILADPAPQGCVAVNTHSVSISDEEKRECGDSWHTVAPNQVWNFHSS